MKIHIIQHESFEKPGSYLDWALKRGHQISWTKCYLGEKVPSSSENYDALLIMGGPQSPDTSKAECPYFDSEAEISLIKSFSEKDKLIIGVCLGAQLIGKALGARHEKSPEKEIGTIRLCLTEEGLKDKYLGPLGKEFDSSSWHNDMPGLTEKSKILAYSQGCPRQIIRYSKWIYGFQCHMEFTTDLIQSLIKESSADLEDSGKRPFVQSPQQLLSFDYSEMNKKLWNFLDSLTSDYLLSLNN